MAVLEMSEPGDAAGNSSARWRLHRAGIVNVYQYDNEVLHFGGGRLLLRGVNGSGKSTAMNMLLPFLLTAKQRGIDAAGEQTGVLRSWMLNGRDDSQPVGYLWIEFERFGEHLACGCGIRANRASGTVTTWWFVTSQRPGIDFGFVGRGKVPVTVDGLRALLGEGEVFSEGKRREYRREIERRLFGGASIDQHIDLIHLARDPRVGDRIDLELPQRLVDALPQLSEQALAEAAQPLDDLEEHRRNVTDLKRTVSAVDGLLDVYRAYGTGDLRRRMTEGAAQLDELRRRVREEKAAHRVAQEADAAVEHSDGEIARLEREVKRLESEISALEESQAYKSGKQLTPLENLVRDLDRQVAKAEERVAASKERAEGEGVQVSTEQTRSRGDLQQLNDALADATRLAVRCRLDSRPTSFTQISETALALETTQPAVPFDAGTVERSLYEAEGAATRRRGELAEVEEGRRRLDETVEQQRRADEAQQHAEAAAQRAAASVTERTRALEQAQLEWVGQARLWGSGIVPLLQADGLESPAANALVDPEGAAVSPENLKAELDLTALALVNARVEAVAGCEHRLAAQQAVCAQAESVVDELAARSEPEPPRFGWQVRADHCLADLIDFEPSLDDERRAGLEAALEASGLLSARLSGKGVELLSGDLVAIAYTEIPNPLSSLLCVAVPDRLAAVVDASHVAKLLDSISADASAGSATAAAVDGTFRVGALQGRHQKEQAEFIGAAARRDALERDRRAAAEVLKQARAVLNATQTELAALEGSREVAIQMQADIPDTSAIETATGALEAAIAAEEEATTTRLDAAVRVSEAEREAAAAADELQRRAVSLGLPSDPDGLKSFGEDLKELATTLERCRARTVATARSTAACSQAAQRWRTAVEDLRKEQTELKETSDERERQNDRLATIRDSIGEEYQRIVERRDRCRTEKGTADTGLSTVRNDQRSAIERRARSKNEAERSTEVREQTERECEAVRQSLADAAATPGLLDALTPADDSRSAEQVVSHQPGPEGLRGMLTGLEQLLAGPDDRTPVDTADVFVNVDVNSVYQSLRQRRDTLGAGWDAEIRQPAEPTLPISVYVSGPLGRAPLARAAQAASEQHRQLAGLLDQKQAEALRGLLQGLIATEIAEKVHASEGFVEFMNERLASVTTAHDVGARLRWRLSPELDAPTARMVELLTKRPDLRLEGDQQELRALLSERLAEARLQDPEGPYRQLIAEALDYKQWYEMSVMVQRSDGKEARLSRRTPLSEGEKKILTYLTLFAAVAASYDALAAQSASPETDWGGIAKFVLLDDAFAKVSEDNHADLFGIIVDLDLDLIATSERLWGTHHTVPQLAITEVVRDSDLKTILLEQYHWDGAVLAPRPGQ